jgi:hypothetical protein
MASKIKNAKLAKDARIPEGPPFHRAPAKPSGLYLLELRSHTARAHALLYRRKLDVAIDPNHGEDGHPQPIKINHA